MEQEAPWHKESREYYGFLRQAIICHQLGACCGNCGESFWDPTLLTTPECPGESCDVTWQFVAVYVNAPFSLNKKLANELIHYTIAPPLGTQQHVETVDLSKTDLL